MKKIEKRWIAQLDKWAATNGLVKSQKDPELWESHVHDTTLEVRFIDGTEVHLNLEQDGKTIIGFVAPLYCSKSVKELFDKEMKSEFLVLADNLRFSDVRNIASIRCYVCAEQKSTSRWAIGNYEGLCTDGKTVIGLKKFLTSKKYITANGNVKRGYKVFQEFPKGLFDKDLFWPVKKGINGYFFNDDYRIDDFSVEVLAPPPF